MWKSIDVRDVGTSRSAFVDVVHDKEKESRVGDTERALEAVTRRIEGIRSATNVTLLTSMQVSLLGYLDALEDQGLLSEREVANCKVTADKAGDERMAELVASARLGK